MSNDKPQTPTLPGVIDGAITARLKNLRVAMPARVETYDAATQSCSCQPLVYDGYFDETGRRQAEKLPVVASVPVVFPGSGAFSVTWPVSPGDIVLLVFSSSSIDRWLTNGGEVDPIDDRRHHLTDAIAIPGVRDFQHALGSAAMDNTAMVISGPSIKLGSLNAVEAAIKGDAFMTAMDVLLSAIATAVATPATATAGVNAAKAIFDTAALTFKSAIVKVG